MKANTEGCVLLLRNAVEKSKYAVSGLRKNKRILFSAKYQQELDVLVALQKKCVLSNEAVIFAIRNAPNLKSISDTFQALSFRHVESISEIIDALSRYLADLDFSVSFNFEFELEYLFQILRIKQIRSYRQDLLCQIFKDKRLIYLALLHSIYNF